MCTISMIYDKFGDNFQPWTIPNAPLDNQEALKDLIAEFKKAREAAEIVDEALGNADCADPEKAKLVERVAELEKALKDALGTYVLKDREWYLTPTDAYTTQRAGARLFQSKDEAEDHAATLVPAPRAVKIVRK